MKLFHPQFRVTRSTPAERVWKGDVTPTALSDTYEIAIQYKLGSQPRIDVISPKLILAVGADELPHTYPDEGLCLYYPKAGEWHPGRAIADYIVPWITMWLTFYEGWLATSTWHGGGIEHGPAHRPGPLTASQGND